VSVRVGVVVFPGTNCEFDVATAVGLVGAEPALVWHGCASLGDVDAVVVPGGFAHGDYLRTGAIARFSPVMADVERFAADGGPVLGICNGFQVLCEAGLLPGALRRNAGMKFLCQPVELEVVSTRTVVSADFERGRHLTIPVNHFEGNYVADADTIRQLVADDRIVFRYVDNPNGALADAAAVCNEAGNVVGMMPHPERATDALLGSSDGLAVLAGFVTGADARSAGRRDG
jgi:phosphoribosylformylglycinamidine synthase subunit PurQ / glutaminase